MTTVKSGRLAARAGTVLSVLITCGCAVAAPSENVRATTPLDGLRSAAAHTSRPRLLARVYGLTEEFEASNDGGGRQFCFVENPTPEQMAVIEAMYQAKPVSLFHGPQDRFFTSGTVWTGVGQQGNSGMAARADLTYSFPDDNVTWGSGPSAPNALNAKLTQFFGSGNEDRGREFIRQGLASWRRIAGLTYSEVADNNTAFSQSTTHLTTRGDIRIGGIPQGTSGGVLAYNFFPAQGGDMTINTDFFTSGSLASSSNNYRYLRNVVAHEHGHGLGYIHVTPCNQTKLMEPFASSNFDGTRIDDWRGAGANYGDVFAGNNSAAAASNFGDLTSPLRSVIVRNLSTNGASGPNNTDEDWFRFTIGSAQNVVVSVQPTGGTYQNGQQTSGCNPTSPASINATAAGNLDVELRTNNGASVLLSGAVNGAGLAETITANGLTAGTYWVRVVDVGPNSAQSVQLYDLTIRVGTAKAPPTAIAGLNKRIRANTNCFFMGDINSAANESGASLSAYAWDLDGNATFETSGAQVSRQYPSNGVYNVSLRVTDTNGQTAIDTVQLTVFGATTAINAVTPTSASAGTTVPVIITGTNLRGVTNASQITVSGSGVTAIGVPSVDPLGTQITGLSFQVTAGAPQGQRTITVTNSDGQGGSATSAPLFTVGSTTPSNDECSAPVGWGSSLGSQSVNNTGATTSPANDMSGTSCSGSVNNDVWYSWTAPASGSLSLNTNLSLIGFNSRIAVYTGLGCSPTHASLLGCAQSDNPVVVPVMVGQAYLIRFGAVTAGQTAFGTANLSLTPFTGACCSAGGACNELTQSACAAQSGVYSGDNTACTPNPCTQPNVACCFPNGGCTFVVSADCVSAGGTPQTLGSSCSPNPCPINIAACCFNDGACSTLSPGACTGQGGTGGGAGSTCTPNTCPVVNVACCFTGGSCQPLKAADCGAQGGTAQAPGSTCSPNPCPQPMGACCRLSGACSQTVQPSCSGTWTPGASCVPNPCPQPSGACCLSDGTCTETSPGGCTGTWTAFEVCDPSPCPEPSGTCCAPDGACAFTTQAACSNDWSIGGSCSPNPCPPPTGACCSGVTCAVMTAAECSGTFAVFRGSGTTCNAPGDNLTPCCRADFNQNGVVEVQDIFDYLNAWFQADPRADWVTNGAGAPTVQSIFDYLNGWFVGC